MKTKEDIEAEKVEAEARRVARITVDLGLPGRPVMKEKTDSSITLALLRQGQKVLLLHPSPTHARLVFQTGKHKCVSSRASHEPTRPRTQCTPMADTHTAAATHMPAAASLWVMQHHLVGPDRALVLQHPDQFLCWDVHLVQGEDVAAESKQLEKSEL